MRRISNELFELLLSYAHVIIHFEVGVHPPIHPLFSLLYGECWTGLLCSQVISMWRARKVHCIYSRGARTAELHKCRRLHFPYRAAANDAQYIHILYMVYATHWLEHILFGKHTLNNVQSVERTLFSVRPWASISITVWDKKKKNFLLFFSHIYLFIHIFATWCAYGLCMSSDNLKTFGKWKLCVQI